MRWSRFEQRVSLAKTIFLRSHKISRPWQAASSSLESAAPPGAWYWQSEVVLLFWTGLRLRAQPKNKWPCLQLVLVKQPSVDPKRH
jgi:hypothetical protein